MKTLKSCRHLSGSIVGLALFSGCFSGEAPTYTVSGTVFDSDGKPLPGGVLILEPLENQSKANPRGTIGPDGSFTLKTPPDRAGAEAGKYRVMVQAFDPAYDDAQAPRDQLPPQLIHSRYQRFDTSDIEITIEPKDNDVTLRVDRPR